MDASTNEKEKEEEEKKNLKKSTNINVQTCLKIESGILIQPPRGCVSGVFGIN